MSQDLALSCKVLGVLVTAYDEGVLRMEEWARFDEHLTECPDCVEYLAQFTRMCCRRSWAAAHGRGGLGAGAGRLRRGR
jgi:predicted anti-sigma-YlaC factor YlaD